MTLLKKIEATHYLSAVVLGCGVSMPDGFEVPYKDE